MDWGCTTTSTCSGGVSKSQRASHHFEPLVHQRRRVDRDLGTHLPGGMLQRLLRRHRVERLARPLAKGTARSGQDEPPDIRRIVPAQALVNGVVLAVHRQDVHAAPLRRRHHQAAGHHQHFLVGQRHRLAGLDCRQGGVERSRAGRGAQHDVHVRVGRHGQQSLCSRVGPVGSRARPAERSLHLLQRRGRRHGDDARAVAPHLLGEARGVAPGGEPHDCKAPGLRLHHRERAAADGAGRAEDGNPSHGLLEEKLEADVVDRRCEQPAVDAVEHAAVAGNDV